MTDERKAQHQLQLAGEDFHRGDQRASLEAYKKAFLAAPPRWQHRYYSFAGACSLLEGEDLAEESANVKSNDRDMVFLKVRPCCCGSVRTEWLLVYTLRRVVVAFASLK